MDRITYSNSIIVVTENDCVMCNELGVVSIQDTLVYGGACDYSYGLRD